MSETPVVEQPVPEEIKNPFTSWQELREYHQSTPFSEHAKKAFAQIRDWESTPRVGVDPQVWKKVVDEQVRKAEQLSKDYPSAQNIEWIRTNKIVAAGKEMPNYGQDVLTRIYLGIDPRRATDAYIALLAEFDRLGCLKDIESSLNLEELKTQQLVGNTIILYDPQSRPDVLNKILEGYRVVKAKRPELFALIPRQKASILRHQIRQFKGTIDENMSFVEIAPEEGGRSFDADVIGEITNVVGMRGRTFSDEEFLNIVEHHSRRPVFSVVDASKIDRGEFKSGDTIPYKRSMSSPFLIQRGEITYR